MTTFAEFGDTLTAEERDALFGSIPMIIAMVVGADGEFDAIEMDETIEVLFEAGKQLGEEFHWSEVAQESFDRLCEMARDPQTAGFHGRLLQLRDVLRQAPPELRARYHEFVLRMTLRLASASGGFLGFGRPISEEEKIALRKIVIALEIPVEDPELREFLDSE